MKHPANLAKGFGVGDSAESRRFNENSNWVDQTDGRTLGIPVASFPCVLHATIEQLLRFEFSHDGLYWHGLDENI